MGNAHIFQPVSQKNIQPIQANRFENNFTVLHILDLKIAFRATNTIQQQLNAKQTHEDPSGKYELKCKTCNKAYVGQSGKQQALGIKNTCDI